MGQIPGFAGTNRLPSTARAIVAVRRLAIVELMLAHTQLSLLITQIRTGSVPLARCARVSCFSGSALPAPPPPPGPPLAGPPPEPNAGLIDIGANLLDTMFQGEYRGKQAHPPDLQAVLERAAASGASGGRKQDRYGRPARRGCGQAEARWGLEAVLSLIWPWRGASHLQGERADASGRLSPAQASPIAS